MDKEEQQKISIDDFKKIQARVGRVVVAEAVPDSDKLIRFEIDFGDERRQILSAIRQWYPEPSALLGKQLLFCTNLVPRTIRGFESNGMLMAVSDEQEIPILLTPEHSVPDGSMMR
ncbi:MAG TPA: hypothetical protein VG621_01265 [Candidatus Paceibacterota bacterium]|nr:hypothetical protein [Candidatus Paceibacterota bacterium]